jgi:putative glutamine amidotransferase
MSNSNQTRPAWRNVINDLSEAAQARFARARRRRTLRVGISARIFHPQPDSKGLESKTLQYLEQSVAHWVMARNVLVFMVPVVNSDGLIHRSDIRLSDYSKNLDGLVLQGGADLSPANYGETPLKPEWAGDRARDSYEMELVNEFIDRGKPILGICRGLQLINVAFGGSLYQDLPTQLNNSREHRSDQFDRHYHEIRFDPGSGLARLYPELAKARVNSIHHQAIKNLGRDLEVEARSEEDHVIEAIRWKGPSYVFGVQWHPEFHHPSDNSLLNCTPVLDEFLTAARKRLWL